MFIAINLHQDAYFANLILCCQSTFFRRINLEFYAKTGQQVYFLPFEDNLFSRLAKFLELFAAFWYSWREFLAATITLGRCSFLFILTRNALSFMPMINFSTLV